MFQHGCLAHGPGRSRSAWVSLSKQAWGRKIRQARERGETWEGVLKMEPRNSLPDFLRFLGRLALSKGCLPGTVVRSRLSRVELLPLQLSQIISWWLSSCRRNFNLRFSMGSNVCWWQAGRLRRHCGISSRSQGCIARSLGLPLATAILLSGLNCCSRWAWGCRGWALATDPLDRLVRLAIIFLLPCPLWLPSSCVHIVRILCLSLPFWCWSFSSAITTALLSSRLGFCLGSLLWQILTLLHWCDGLQPIQNVRPARSNFSRSMCFTTSWWCRLISMKRFGHLSLRTWVDHLSIWDVLCQLSASGHRLSSQVKRKCIDVVDASGWVRGKRHRSGALEMGTTSKGLKLNIRIFFDEPLGPFHRWL